MAIDPSQLPPEAREKVEKLAQVQEQVQSLARRKQELEKESQEKDKALDELENIEKDRTIYKSVGAVMVKRENPEEVREELKDRLENLDLKIKQIERKEEKMKKQLEDLRAKVQDAIQGGATTGMGRGFGVG